MADPVKVVKHMLARQPVVVTTETRFFTGRIFDLGLSPFTDETRCGVVAEDGRVNYFYVERAKVRAADGAA